MTRKTTYGSCLAVSAALALGGLSCGERQGPTLCIFQSADGIEEADCAASNTALTSIPKTKAPLWIRYRLPPGVKVDDPVHLEIATPCSCSSFDRTLGVSTLAPSEGGSAAQSDTQEVVMTFVPPEGAACSLRVSATLQNSALTKQFAAPTGDVACQNLQCGTITRCNDAGSTSSGAGAGGAGGGGSTSTTQSSTGTGG